MKNFNFLYILLILFSCKKEPSEIGLNLRQNDQLVKGFVTDTISIIAYTIQEDSFTTDERSFQLLGSYLDPVFGYTEASFVTQIFLTTSNVSFGSNPIIDSVVMTLDYQSYYGDTTVSHNVFIYEIEKDIYYDSVYYSNFKIDEYIPSQNLIANFEYYPRPTSGLLHFKLSNEFGQKILNASQTDLTSNNSFVKYIKGLYFKTEPNYSKGSIISFNLLNPNSKITLYYHNDNNTNLKYDLIITNKCARVNIFKHDYSYSTITSINDTTGSDTLLYLQGAAGLNVLIKFPFIKQFSKLMPFAIVKADLVIPIKEDHEASIYKTPSRLLLVSKNAKGAYELLPDYNVSTSYFNGNKDDTKKEYRFNIARYIQQLASGQKEDKGLILMVADNRVAAHRVIIKNSNSLNRQMKLVITYIKP
ncbi:MAG: DUF4270 domain-containing protein [Bacteroidales bacterium]|nr:DUF4270 domain-containing protein [Bacteroidales bacterium]